MKIAAVTALVSGGMAPVLAIIDPADLKGLEPAALATIVSIVALGVVVYQVKSLVPAMNSNTKALTVTNERVGQLCTRIDNSPCLAQSAEDMKRDAKAILDEAKREALTVVDVARVEALRLIKEARRRTDK